MAIAFIDPGDQRAGVFFSLESLNLKFFQILWTLAAKRHCYDSAAVMFLAEQQRAKQSCGLYGRDGGPVVTRVA